MSKLIIISDCEIKVWRRGKVSKYIDFAGVEICVDVNTHCILIKQCPELCDSTSFVSWELDSYTYLIPNHLSAESTILCLQLNENVSATAHIDNSADPSVIKDELATLEMCCSMSNTKLDAGWTMNITVPQYANYQNQVETLIQILRKHTSREDAPTNSEPSTALDTKLKSVMESLTLSERDLNYLEITVGGAMSSIEASNNGNGHKITSNRNVATRSRNQRHLKPLPLRVSPQGVDIEREETVRKKWDEAQEMWAGITVSKSKRDDAAGLTQFDSSGRAIRSTTSYTINPLEPRHVPGLHATGGYLQEPDRDYSKINGLYYMSPWTARRLVRQRYRKTRSYASFTPTTNATAVSSSTRRDRKFGSIAYKSYDVEEEDEEK